MYGALENEQMSMNLRQIVRDHLVQEYAEEGLGEIPGNNRRGRCLAILELWYSYFVHTPSTTCLRLLEDVTTAYGGCSERGHST